MPFLCMHKWVSQIMMFLFVISVYNSLLKLKNSHMSNVSTSSNQHSIIFTQKCFILVGELVLRRRKNMTGFNRVLACLLALLLVTMFVHIYRHCIFFSFFNLSYLLKGYNTIRKMKFFSLYL